MNIPTTPTLPPADQLVTTLVFGLAIGIAVISTRFVTGSLTSQKDAEDIYKELNSALEKKVQTLEKNFEETEKKIESLKSEIFTLTSKNKAFEGLIILGLQSYFEAHPKEARALGRAQLAPNLTK